MLLNMTRISSYASAAVLFSPTFLLILLGVLHLEDCLFGFQIVLHAKLDLLDLRCQTLSKCVFQSSRCPTVPLSPISLGPWTPSAPLCF